MVSELEPGPIVRRVNNVGVVGEFQVVQRLEQATDLGVDVLDDVDVSVLRIWVADFIRHVERNVRHGMRQVDEERLVLVGRNEVDGLLGVAPRDRALVHGQLDDFLVLEERGLPLSERRLRVVPENVHACPTASGFPLVVGMVHVVGVWNTKVSVEAVGGG